MSPSDRSTPSSKLGLGRLLRLARPEAKTLCIATVFLFLGGAASLLFPQAVRILVDGALGQGHSKTVDRASAALLVIFLLQSFAIAFRYYLFTVAGERIVTRLREQLYRNLIEQEIAFFDEQRTGELTHRLAADTTVLQNTVSVNISMALRHLLQGFGGVALLLYTSPYLTAWMLMVVPPVAIGAVVYGRRIKRLSKQVQDSLAEAGEVAEETLAGVRTVRAFAREEAERERYGGALWRSFEVAKERTGAVAIFLATASFAGYGAVAFVLWLGSRMVTAGSLSIGGLTSFLLYTMTVAFATSALASLWSDFMRSAGAAERIFSLLDRTPAMSLKGGKTLGEVEGLVRLEGLGFHYPSRPDVTVLSELDLEIPPGTVLALVGPSGGGKSTIARLLGRLYDPDAGRILLDGVDLRELDASWLRSRIAVVAQEPVLFSTSIAKNIRYGCPEASQEQIEVAARAANAHDFIVALPEGYETLVGERGVRLSGGQKQRVAIARAVLKNPPLLILDEATSALDAESEALVKEALERLMKQRTTLVIAHRLSTVRDAHQIAVLVEGRVLEQGSHQELLAQAGLYSKLISRQFVAAEA